jgi:hypothetical protein
MAESSAEKVDLTSVSNSRSINFQSALLVSNSSNYHFYVKSKYPKSAIECFQILFSRVSNNSHISFLTRLCLAALTRAVFPKSRKSAPSRAFGEIKRSIADFGE